MVEKSKTQINTIKIHKAIEAQIPLLITTFTLPHDMELYIADVITAFLKELNQDFMTEYLIYSINELVTNAKKANTKRVYFEEKGLDITNENDYAKGMIDFKKNTLENILHYLHLQKKENLFIKLILHYRNGKIKVEVRNNSALTVFEYKRIHDKIARAQQYDSIEDAFSQILDDTEGAGLGLVIMCLMLKKIGLSEDNFQYLCENGETITRLVLPLSPEIEKNINTISSDIVNSIEELPHFPDNIANINRLLNDPNSKLSDIAQQISNDITMTADLLKLVNSAAFSLSSPCQNIVKAVQLVGTRGIKNLLYSLGSMQSLGQNDDNKKELWTHSYKVAFFAYNIARNFFRTKRDIIEDSYVCGLLHDMGKVLFDNAHPDLIRKFETLCSDKDISVTVIEKLSAGVNHAEIGALIAEKWNFPEVIAQSIRYHHTPTESPIEYRQICSVVYMANMISHYQDEEIEFYQFDSDILQLLNIDTKEQLDKISERLQAAFAKSQS